MNLKQIQTQVEALEAVISRMLAMDANLDPQSLAVSYRLYPLVERIMDELKTVREEKQITNQEVEEK